MTPISRFGRAGAAVVCLALAGVPSAYAFDLNPFHRDAPAQTAQTNAPPGTIPTATDSDGSDNAGALDVRVDHLENELRQANGRIEELENQQRRLEDTIKRFQQDVEFRLGNSGAGAVRVPGAVAAAPNAAVPPIAPLADAGSPVMRPGRRDDAFNPATDPNAVGAPRALGTTAPSAPLELSGGRPPAPAPTSVAALPTGPLRSEPSGLAAAPPVSGTGIGFTDGPREQYNTAVETYRSGQYAKAEDQLKAFLATNAGNRLAPDAIFFLGETYFQRSRPREAAEQYLKLSTNFSRSARAPEGMLRLGQSLAQLGSGEQACATFAEVGKRYPSASAAVKKLAEREMQKSHC